MEIHVKNIPHYRHIRVSHFKVFNESTINLYQYVHKRFLKMNSKRNVYLGGTFNIPRHFLGILLARIKNKPTNIPFGPTWYCRLTTGDSSCFVKVILGGGYDTLWARYSLTSCWDVFVGLWPDNTQRKHSTFSTQNVTYLHGLLICPHLFSSSSNMSVNSVMKGIGQVWEFHTGVGTSAALFTLLTFSRWINAL